MLVLALSTLFFVYANASEQPIIQDQKTFVDQAFKESIIFQRDIDYPERIGQPLSNEYVESMTYVIIHEDYEPKTYEDIYLFPSIQTFYSYDMYISNQQYFEIIRYMKSIDLDSSGLASFDAMIPFCYQYIKIDNPLTEDILNSILGLESIDKERYFSELPNKIIQLEPSHFEGRIDQLTPVINELTNLDFITVIDCTSLNLNDDYLNQFEQSHLTIDNGIIRKLSEYEMNLTEGYGDLKNPDIWYYDSLKYCLDNELIDYDINDTEKLCEPNSNVTYNEAAMYVIKSIHHADDNKSMYIHDWFESSEAYKDNELISRYEFANMIHSAYQEAFTKTDLKENQTAARNYFADWDEIPDSYKDGAATLMALKLTNGQLNEQGQTIFNGNASISKGMMAVLLQRLINVQ